MNLLSKTERRKNNKRKRCFVLQCCDMQKCAKSSCAPAQSDQLGILSHLNTHMHMWCLHDHSHIHTCFYCCSNMENHALQGLYIYKTDAHTKLKGCTLKFLRKKQFVFPLEQICKNTVKLFLHKGMSEKPPKGVKVYVQSVIFSKLLLLPSFFREVLLWISAQTHTCTVTQIHT